jgi:hypothetical protein
MLSALALYFVFYHFVRRHQSLRVSPASRRHLGSADVRAAIQPTTMPIVISSAQLSVGSVNFLSMRFLENSSVAFSGLRPDLLGRHLAPGSALLSVTHSQGAPTPQRSPSRLREYFRLGQAG